MASSHPPATTSGAPSQIKAANGKRKSGIEQSKKHKKIVASSDNDDDDDVPSVSLKTYSYRCLPPAPKMTDNDFELQQTKRSRLDPLSNGSRLSVSSAKKSVSRAATDSNDWNEPLTRESRLVAEAIETSPDACGLSCPLSPGPMAGVKREPVGDDSDDEPLGKRSQIFRRPSSAAAKKRMSPLLPERTRSPAFGSQRIEFKSESPEVEEDVVEDDREEEDEEEDEEEEGEDDEDESGGVKKTSQNNGVKHNGDGNKMWETLWHTGPRFPPPYQPLPIDIKMKYDGKAVELPATAEEAALFYAVKLETPYVKDPVFNSNFFKDFHTILEKNPPLDGTKISDFKKCDFSQMCEYQKELKEAEKERKKKLAPSARKKEQQNKKDVEEEMKTCLVDGKKQRVGNVMVEPPALFMGRGQHPKRGQIKPRVRPEEITINHTLNDPEHPPPLAPAGHQWKAVVEMKDVTWLAHWIDFNGNYKYVYLDAASSFKSNSDREKFEKARKLDLCVKKLRKRVEEMLVSKSRQERQLGTVIWLIDNYSLRAGNEKGEDEAATYGVCSLLVEHVKELIDEENKVQLEFLGKDSMLFKETLEVPERIFKNIKMFTRSTKDVKGKIALKKPADAIFERIDTSHVNKFLRDPKEGGMPGLSAKVFRTYNASTTFQGLLNKTADNLRERGLEPTLQSLKDEYMQANRLVAILCNHQKTINPQVAERQLARANEKMIALKYYIHKERQKILKAYRNIKDIKKDFSAKDHKDFDWHKFLEEDLKLSDEQIKEHEERTIAGKIARMEAAFERQEREREYQLEQVRKGGIARDVKEGKGGCGRKKEVRDESEEDEENKGIAGKCKSREDVEEEKKRLQESLKVLEKERKSGKSQMESDSIKIEACARKIKQKFQAIEKFQADLESKNKTSDVSLGTSKINYVDPRVTVSFLKHWDKILVEREEKFAGKKANGKVKQENEASVDEKKTFKKRDGSGNDKLELGLQKLPIGQYFPAALQKKFKWADTDDSTTGRLPSTWTFVPDAENKVRTNYSSAQRKEIEEEVAATRKDDKQRGGNATTSKKDLKKSSSAGKKSPATLHEDLNSDDNDSDSGVPLGAKR